MTRKIIQLVPTYDEDEMLVMYGLCDDGTVYVLEEDEMGTRWRMVDADLPQVR